MAIINQADHEKPETLTTANPVTRIKLRVRGPINHFEIPGSVSQEIGATSSVVQLPQEEDVHVDWDFLDTFCLSQIVWLWF